MTGTAVAIAVYAILTWQYIKKDPSRVFDIDLDQPTVLNIAAISAFEPKGGIIIVYC